MICLFISDLETLEANKDKMRCKMEMMLMRIQKEFCQALENEEDPRYVYDNFYFLRLEIKSAH